MRRILITLVLALFLGLPVVASGPVARKVGVDAVVLSGELPDDLLHPEGKSRWDLTGLTVTVGRTFTVEAAEGAATATGPLVPAGHFAAATDSGASANGPAAGGQPRPNASLVVADGSSRMTYSDITGGDAAARWLLPEGEPAMMRLGSRETLDLDERRSGSLADRLRIEIETVGIGWVHLPSGAHEVVLQRALVLRERAGSRGYAPEALVHRWVDPRSGIVAEVSGPPTPDGRARATVADASVLRESFLSAATLKIYVDEIDEGFNKSVLYGWDKGTGTAINTLTTPAFTTAGQLIAADTWNFSPVVSGTEVAATTVPMNASETCNSIRCGYPVPNPKLERRDRAFGTPGLQKFNSVQERENRANDVVLWLRAGSQKEGVAGGFGSGETRFCYVTDDNGDGTVRTRTPVPEWDFTHPDLPRGYYMQAGDAWQGGPFLCEQNLFNQVCGSTPLFDKLYTKACSGHAGTQTFNVLKGGVVTLPSGHTFNALLVRTVADFCVYSGPTCGLQLDAVRTVVYLWQVPHLGTVVRIQSVQNAADTTSFTTVAETDVKFGLFPPRAITATASTNNTVTLSWDPGVDTHRITNYKIYWDTDSGASTAYAFNSVANAGQVAFAGTMATISGLTPGVTYYFTVTSRSIYTDPSSSIVTTYESLLYPTQVSGDPSFIYPIEVQRATTGGTCIPTAEVSGVTVTKSPETIQICWNPVSDPCLVGYRILGANSPTSDANFSTVADVGLTTCFTGSPTKTDYLVVARGTGGTGPWGSYGH